MGLELVPNVSYPWEQQEGETSTAYAAFVIYRDMPVMERSIARAAKLRDAAGRVSKGSDVARQLEEWSSRHRWVDRSAAWDQEQDRVRREEQLNEIRAMSVRHAQQAEATLRAALEPAQAFLRRLRDDPRCLDELSPSELIDLSLKAGRVVPQLVQVERLARGQTTESVKVEHVGPQDPLGEESYAVAVHQAMREAGLLDVPDE